MSSRDLDFLYEVGSMRNCARGWKQHLGTDCASTMEHTLRVAWIALILSRRAKQGNEEKILKIALAHDIDENRVSDLSYVQKVYVKADEEAAIHDTFQGTILDDFEELLQEYQKRECIEAQFVKDADNLDIDLEMKELEERGQRVPPAWNEFRKTIRNQKH